VNCRLCRSPDLAPVPFHVPECSGRWFRCAACGSDSAEHGYPEDLYSRDYEVSEVNDSGGHEARVQEIASNLDWFGHHAEGLPNKDFLDVGCCDGAGLRGMQDRGWSVHGFDVFEPSYMGPHVTVAPFFHRWLFPLRYSAVLCREVLEHVECPQMFLVELHGVTIPGGLVQIQTPRPIDHAHPIPYQRQHLHLASPVQLNRMLHAAMLDVLDERTWDMGQAYLCRARR
jgi:2-polyprenyl-3-methyl-5-hydroxy-6-metoxy-1,4-benzoquinol methylase